MNRKNKEVYFGDLPSNYLKEEIEEKFGTKSDKKCKIDLEHIEKNAKSVIEDNSEKD